MPQRPRAPLPLNRDDLWVELRHEVEGPARPALFVDRDGTLVEEVDFLHRAPDVRAVPGAARTLASARAAGWLVVVVTNQSGIGRGYFDWTAFAAVQEEMSRQLAREGAAVDMVVACGHHPEGIGRYAHPEHPARKPAAGMLLAAAERLPVDLPRSVIIGDRASDLAAGRAAGLGRGYLVRTGYGAGQSEAALSLRSARFRVGILDSIAGWSPPESAPGGPGPGVQA